MCRNIFFLHPLFISLGSRNLFFDFLTKSAKNMTGTQENVTFYLKRQLSIDSCKMYHFIWGWASDGGGGGSAQAFSSGYALANLTLLHAPIVEALEIDQQVPKQ